jgi:DNA repair exonuclease SbcCD ATPase subunit
LKDILHFKQAKFVFKPGITIIRGLNRNGELKKNTNGVGKSLLFSCIPNIIYATTPLAKKNDKKSLFRTDKSEIRFTFKKDKTVWTIIQRAKKASIAYQILKDGTDQKPRTSAIAEAKIKELFGISEEMFYTKDYISIQRPHLFLRGTPTQRQEFFTEVFKLDHYDNLRANFLLQIRELKAKKTKLDVYKEQLSELDVKIQDLDWTNEKESSINELETKINSLNKTYVSSVTEISDVQAMLNIAQQVVRKSEKVNSELSSDEIRAKRKDLKVKLKEVQDYAEYKRSLSKYKKDTAKLQERLEDLTKALKEVKKDGDDLGKLHLSEIRKSLDSLLSKRTSFRTDVKTLTRLRSDYSELEEQLDGCKKPKLSVEQLLTRIGELEQIIDLHRSVNSISKECPLCGSAISKSDIRRIADAASDELPKRKKELGAIKKFESLKSIKKEAATYTDSEDKLKEIETKISKLESQERRIEKYNRIREAISDTEESLEQIHKPKSLADPQCDSSEEKLESRIQSLSTTLSGLAELEELKEENLKINPENKSVKTLTREVKGLRDTQEKLSGRINKINEKLPTLLAQQKQIVDHVSSRDELTEKISKIEIQLEDYPVLEALIKAYGSKGLKVEVMKKIATLVEANLNKYKSLIFAEDFVFKINIAENQFSVLVDRPNGVSSDISKLSGAEGASFTLLLLLSMLPLIPRRLRADTIVLDECDAYLGPPLKELFFTKFLPILATIVPKVCVISTADSKLKVEGARNILIEKDGADATVKEVYELEGLL